MNMTHLAKCLSDLETLRISIYNKIDEIELNFLKEVNEKITHALSEHNENKSTLTTPTNFTLDSNHDFSYPIYT